jgi:hypothetical protein
MPRTTPTPAPARKKSSAGTRKKSTASHSRKNSNASGTRKTGRRKKRGTRKKSTRKYGATAQKKVQRSMHEMKRGELRSGRSGKRVTSRKQAIAIGLSEARSEGGKVPSRRKRS